MTVLIENFLADIGEERRAAIEAGAAEIVAEQQTLAALRRARGLTQAQVAEAMETSQANVAQIERKKDILVSTIARVVHALGAELQVSARFPDGQVVPLKIGRDGRVSERAHPAPPPPQMTGQVYARQVRRSLRTMRTAAPVESATAMVEFASRFGGLRGTISPDPYKIDASGAASSDHRAQFYVERISAVKHPQQTKTYKGNVAEAINAKFRGEELI